MGIYEEDIERDRRADEERNHREYIERQKQVMRSQRVSRPRKQSYRSKGTRKKSKSLELGNIISIFGWAILFTIILKACNS
ncbi:hypothetical protein [Aquimarina longa]|uniref:hypothetical protein n=1 Tax=Aquimarina longa TaxID=1080221 RepID=UPI000781192C|nr:hypothetical protein [Aquimarina longa]